MKPAHIAIRATVLLAVSAPAAVVCGQQVGAQLRVASAGRPATVDDVVGRAATLGSWAVLGWIALTITVAAAAALPGAAGMAAGRLASAVTPRLIRRLVVVAVGVTVAGSATPAFASVPSGLAAGGTSAEIGQPAGQPTASADDWPSLDRPTADETTVVRPGDCLWTIAAEHLEPDVTPAEIAAEWPRWYAANRALIGPDPNVIRPGQQLNAPPAS